MPHSTKVQDFLGALSHKRHADICVLRQIILSADPAITEHVKWNAPSFCWQGDDRITMRLFPGDRLELIFHRGARKRQADGFAFDDPTGRIAWAAEDRGTLPISDPERERAEIVALVRAWIHATAD
jgi:hypothetical protein